MHSPKTAHHEGKDTRVIPLFPELRPHLEAAYDAAEPESEFVITLRRDATANLRTRFEKIIRRAGLIPWPKLFQNLRSTRETELAESFPIHVVCAWMGNSKPVADRHYLQVTDEHFQRGAKSGALEAQNQVQQAGEGQCVEENEKSKGADDAGLNARAVSTSHHDAPPCTAGAEKMEFCIVGDEGLEPPTLSV